MDVRLPSNSNILMDLDRQHKGFLPLSVLFSVLYTIISLSLLRHNDF
jgi:hypothetical protein